MKKLILSFLVFICVAAAGYCLIPSKQGPDLDHKIGISYNEALKSEKPMLMYFYVDWCSFCKNFMPKLRVLSILYKDKYNIVMIDCDGVDHSKLVDDYGILTYPTIYIADYTNNLRIHLDSKHYEDLGFLRRELDRYLNFKLK